MTEQPPHMSCSSAHADPSFHSCLLGLTFLPTLICLILTCLPIAAPHLHMDIITVHHCPPLVGLVTALLCLITALLHLVTTLPHLKDSVTVLPHLNLKGPIIALLAPQALSSLSLAS